ncbi:MAG: efflux RND transporter periplasmic adaptor subunit [Deltaproteobacteria bacterium]|nr:efflux RND transporter periplasmic adaptor subunit [Deltaproteobacteria bacterium]
MNRLLLAVAVTAMACGSRERPAEAEHKRPAANRAAARSGICPEHGVPEALCTKCNPKLVPVFQARADWCEEHGFPESICPICRGRAGDAPPSAADALADAPADGTKVRLKSPRAVTLAGLKVVEAVEGPVQEGVEAPARLAWDAAGVARVNARAPGVVRAVQADIGTPVAAGASLAEIDSSEAGEGRARRDAAKAREEVARARLERLETLRGEGVTSIREVQEARQALEEARAERAAADAALGVIGAGTTRSGRYRLITPITGVVLKRTATLGSFVASGEVLFEVVDPSRLWAEVDIPESDLVRVAVGWRVTITVPALGNREVTGVLETLAPELDPHTRTVRGRVALDNPDGALRGHMLATARVASGTSEPRVLVPRAAVQHAKGARLVFVRTSDHVFEARRVQTEPAGGDMLAVRGRVKPGDPVVVDGSFLLKTETLKDSIGAGCCGAD